MNYEKKVLKYKGQIVFERLSLPYFKRMPKFYEKDEACFIFLNKGAFSVRTPTKFLSFDKSTALLSKCFNFFFETNKTPETTNEYLEALGVLIHPSMVEELFQFDVSSSTHSVNYNLKQVQIDGLLSNFRDSINILIDNPELADEAIIKNKLKEFILLISKTQDAPSQLDFLSALFKKNETEFKTTILNNIYSSLSVSEFAHLCGMSVSSFKRRFKENFHDSPKRYITKMKLQKSLTMLRAEDARISDIAYDCGFETVSTFNRAFKANFGKSPSEYRLNQFA